MWITINDHKPEEQKTSRHVNNNETEVNETPHNKKHKNNVCINPPPLIKNIISNIPDIKDNKTSNRNTSAKTSNQRENSII